MVTKQDIEARTRMFLDEVSQRKWRDAEVLREINYSYQKVVGAVMQTWQDFYLTNSPFSLVATQQEYGATDGVPDDIYKIRRVELNYDVATNATAFRKAYPIESNQIKTSLSNASMGSTSGPMYYVYGYETTIKIGFVPIPNLNSTNGAKIWYIQKIANLLNSTDVVRIPYAERFSDIIGLEAAGALLRKGQVDEGSASRYIGEAEILRNKMNEELDERIADEAKVIMSSLGASDMDFSEPF